MDKWTALSALVLLCACAVTLTSGNGDFWDGRDTWNIRKRYSVSPSCRRCMFRPGDWLNCNVCYGRPGPVPFYGFSKRDGGGGGGGDYENEAGYVDQQVEPQPEVAKRASFLACKCCISMNNRQCCRKCSLTPYYGKRSSSSYNGYEDTFSGCDTCCDSSSIDFDVDCCLRCSRRK